MKQLSAGSTLATDNDKTNSNWKRAGDTQNSTITEAFIYNRDFLKVYLAGFFSSLYDVEDILQEAYIQAVRAEKIKEIRSPQAFLYKVCKNLALNHLKSAYQRLTEYVGDFENLNCHDHGVLPDDQLEREKGLVKIYGALDLLPPRCRRVFILRKIHGLSKKDTAKLMGISASTVDKHLSKAMKIYREKFK